MNNGTSEADKEVIIAPESIGFVLQNHPLWQNPRNWAYANLNITEPGIGLRQEYAEEVVYRHIAKQVRSRAYDPTELLEIPVVGRFPFLQGTKISFYSDPERTLDVFGTIEVLEPPSRGLKRHERGFYVMLFEGQGPIEAFIPLKRKLYTLSVREEGYVTPHSHTVDPEIINQTIAYMLSNEDFKRVRLDKGIKSLNGYPERVKEERSHKLSDEQIMTMRRMTRIERGDVEPVIRVGNRQKEKPDLPL